MTVAEFERNDHYQDVVSTLNYFEQFLVGEDGKSGAISHLENSLRFSSDLPNRDGTPFTEVFESLRDRANSAFSLVRSLADARFEYVNYGPGSESSLHAEDPVKIEVKIDLYRDQSQMFRELAALSDEFGQVYHVSKATMKHNGNYNDYIGGIKDHFNFLSRKLKINLHKQSHL